jgi:hypothetical protein
MGAVVDDRWAGMGDRAGAVSGESCGRGLAGARASAALHSRRRGRSEVDQGRGQRENEGIDMRQASQPDTTSTVPGPSGAAGSPTTATGVARSARPLPILAVRDRAWAVAGERGKRRTDICDCGLTDDPPYCDGTCGD